MYDIENIPNEDELYCRVHKNNIRDGVLLPGAFKEQGDGEEKGLSTDWQAYSSPEKAQNRAKNPKDNGVIHFITFSLRNINLNVVHAPSYFSIVATRQMMDNQSHSNVRGVDGVKNRLISMDIYKWRILPPVHVEKNTKNFL